MWIESKGLTRRMPSTRGPDSTGVPLRGAPNELARAAAKFADLDAFHIHSDRRPGRWPDRAGTLLRIRDLCRAPELEILLADVGVQVAGELL